MESRFRDTSSAVVRWAQARWRWMLCIAVTTVLVWPVLSAAPAPGVDASWAAGLHMAAARGFGTDIVFSHGPLAFLVIPQMWEESTYPIALFVTLGVVIALIALGADALRRWMPPWAALGGIYFMLVALASFGAAERAPDFVTLVVVLLALRLVQTHLSGRWMVAAPVMTGVFAGMAVLIKVSTGLLAVAALAIAIAAAVDHDRLRVVVTMLASAVASAWGFWLVLGGSLTDFPGWLGYSLEIGRGYAEAMGYQSGATDWHYLVAGVLVASLAWRVVAMAIRTPMSHWLPVALVVLIVVFVVIRQGLARNDAPHAIFAVVALMLALASLPVAGRARLGVGSVLVGGIVVTAIMASAGLTAKWNPWPLPRLQALGDQALSALLPERRAGRIAEARAELRAGYGIPRALQAMTTSHPTAVEGYEIAAAWAYEMDWRPLPVIQSYSAYTAALDQLNAAVLASPRGPDRVIWRQVGLTAAGQHEDDEAPETTLTFVCRFRFAMTEGGWWAYERTPSRCGNQRPFGKEVIAQSGEWIAVPPAPRRDAIVLARITTQLPLTQRVLSALVAPRSGAWIVRRGGFGEVPSRFFTSTGTNALIMRVPSNVVDELREQSTNQVEAFRIDHVADPVRVTFEWVPVAPDASPA